MQSSTQLALNKHKVISIALLNHYVKPSLLKDLSMQLKKRFAYFEILLLNPIIQQDSLNRKNHHKETNYSEKIKHFAPPPPLSQ